MKVDIVIPAWNLYQFTKECIESIFACTDHPFHLIIVDNASVDPAKGYFKTLAQDKENVTLIRNEENLGFVKAVNKGIKTSCARYVCLLNNDTLVTKGWLAEIIKVAQADARIGMVNANSNTLGCKPKKGQKIDELAQELKVYSGKYTELAWTTGFCMLIKREVIEKIGLFDEVYGMGNFEDADFCKRAQLQGYLSVCATASYVYHRERQSFSKFKEFSSDFTNLRKTFYRKWGKTERILYVFTKDNPDFINKIAVKALEYARKGSMIWIFLKDLNSYALNHHSNIYVYRVPENFFNLVSLWRIVKKKKKFDKIFVDNISYKKKLSKLKPFHKAEVLDAE